MAWVSRTTRSASSEQRAWRARRRGGFTLLELVLAAALTAIVLVGLQSAVLIASKAVPSATERADGASNGAALDRIALDLSYAKTIVRADSGTIEFTVADRTGDAADDTIVYSWSGTSKAPLERRFNGGTAEVILPGVTSFGVSSQTETVTGAKTYVESSETLLSSHYAGTTARFTVNTSAWVAQLMPITVPADAVDFRTTRVRGYVRASGSSTGTSAVELRTMRNRVPTTRVLASASVPESSLPGGSTWSSIPLASSRYVDVNEQLGVVIRTTATGPSMEAEYRSSGAASTTGVMLTTANAGGSWTVTSGGALYYELWGVYRVVDSTRTITRAKFMLITLEANGATPLEMNLPLANRPEVTP